MVACSVVAVFWEWVEGRTHQTSGGGADGVDGVAGVHQECDFGCFVVCE